MSKLKYRVLMFLMVIALANIYPMAVYANEGAGQEAAQTQNDTTAFDQAAAVAKVNEYVAAEGKLPRGLTDTGVDTDIKISLPNGDLLGYVSADQLRSWSDGSSSIRGQMEQQTGDFTLRPDMGAAFDIFSGAQDPIAIILGLIAIAIMHVLPLSAALDTLYLISPEFSEKVEQKKEAGGSMVREGKNGKKYMRWISREAQDALEKSYETGQPPYKQFLVFLIIKYVMAAILLAFVFTGNYMTLMYSAMDLIEGLTNMLQ